MKMKLFVFLVVFASSCATADQRMHARGAATSTGMTVVDPSHVLPALPDRTVREVMEWWMGRYPTEAGHIRDFFSRGTILVSAQAEPLTDPWYPQVGKAYGFTRDNMVQVWWNTTLAPEAAASLFDATLRHELGHVALSGAWRAFAAPRDDHAVMKTLGYPWARRKDGGGPVEVFTYATPTLRGARGDCRLCGPVGAARSMCVR